MRRYVLFALALGVTCSIVRADAPFAARRVISATLQDPARVALADLDGDGDLDLAAALQGAGELVWHENTDGKGAFGPRRPVAIVPGITAVAAADLDRDGRPDLACTSATDATRVGWVRNLGGGAFGDPQQARQVVAATPESAGARSVAAADLDGDGDLDLLVAAETTSYVLWFENEGAAGGGAWPQHVVTAAKGGLRHAAAADLDGDGDLDVLSASAAAPVFAWYENRGGGAFGNAAKNQEPISEGGADGRAILAADLDRDGDLDVLTASCADNTLAWHANDDDDGDDHDGDCADGREHSGGDFGARRVISAAADCPVALFVADVDLDGDADVGAAAQGGAVRWFENRDGAGTFAPGRALLGGGAGNVDALAADLDGDGDPDIAAASAGSGAAEWFENRTIHRSGLFPPDARQVIAQDQAYEAVGLADTDRDGDLDVLAASAAARVVALYRNAGDGTFLPAATVGRPAYGVRQLGSADFDRDGRTDVLLAGDGLGWLLNTNEESTWPYFDVDDAPGPRRYAAAIVADVDADGRPDVVAGGVAAEGGEGFLDWYRNVSEPRGRRPPLRFTRRAVDGAAGRDVRAAAVADVDGDGWLDLLAAGAEEGAGFVRWFRNLGAAGFAPAAPVAPDAPGAPGALPGPVDALAAADLDRDGDADVVVGTAGTVTWFANADGAGGRFEARGAVADGGARFLLAADVDLDGDVDVAFGTGGTDGAGGAGGIGALRWAENRDGAGANFRPVTVQDGLVLAALAAGDLDREGDADLVLASGPTLVAWHPNQGGQVAFGGRDAAPPVSWAGEAQALLALSLRVNARAGDPVGRLRSIDIGLYDGAGVTPLTAAQAQASFARLAVFRDDGSGRFEPARDVPVASLPGGSLGPVAGVQRIAFSPEDASARVAAPATFFVVAEFADAAGGSAFRVVHLASAGVVLDGGTEIPLTAEPARDAWSAATAVRVPIRVNGTEDAPDAAPGDGACRSAGGACTLRAAVQEANASPAPDRILLPEGTLDLTLGGVDDAAAVGDLDLAGDLAIVGRGAGRTVVRSTVDARAFEALGASSVTFEGLSLRGGRAEPPSLEGGCLRNSGGRVVFADGEMTGCVAEHGGAVADAPGSSTTLRRAALFTNEAGTGAAALVRGALQLRASTVSSQRATAPAGDPARGALTVLPGGTLDARDATFAANDAPAVANAGGTARLRNSVAARNAGADLAGAFESGGFNFVGDAGGATGLVDGVAGDRVGGAGGGGGGGGAGGAVLDARLGPLGDNGGPTYTHAPLPLSPLLDAGGGCAAPPAPDEGTDPADPAADQRGDPRPLDLPGAPNAGDGCDVGAVEAGLGQTALRVEIPIRWCALRGAPSIEDPALVGALTPDDVVRRRHEAANDAVYLPQANLRWRSAGNLVVESIPLLDDPDCVESAPGVFDCARGQRGDVYVNPEFNNFDEFHDLVARCRAAWLAQDPTITGVTAVQINRFVGTDGQPLPLLGLGGRAAPGDRVAQAAAGRVMVVDAWYRRNATPPDTIDRLLAHELGHALSLEHGDGVDNEGNRVLDDDDDRFEYKPRFDGPNVMQYRTGTQLTLDQVERMRSHALLTIPDLYVELPTDFASNDAPIDPGFGKILDFGFGKVLDFGFGKILDFGFGKILDFGFGKILDFEYANAQEFGFGKILDFGFGKILDFGLEFGTAGAAESADTVTLYSATGGLLWPAPIRPASAWFFYLDLDESAATGGVPPAFVNPASPTGASFPARAGAPPAGVDVIAAVTLVTRCPGQVCSDEAELRVYDYDDAAAAYHEVWRAADPRFQATPLGLLQDNGGADVELENVPASFTVRPQFPLSILTAALPPGTAPFAPGTPVRMEVVTTVDCRGHVVNDDPTSDPVDCVCTDCAVCPDYPGCSGAAGTPEAPAGEDVVIDGDRQRVEFQPPRLPACAIVPAVVAVGQPVTVTVTELPTDVTGTIEVAQGGTRLATEPTSSIDATGTARIQVVPIPTDRLGEVTLSTGIVGFAPRAECSVVVDPNRLCPDADGDGACDADDADDDNDTVADPVDADPLDRFVCQDTDGDACDDCASGTADPGGDGTDTDADGGCDAGDADDDNDTVADAGDAEPLDRFVCRDTDGDACDDCASGTADPAADGADLDRDGLCDAGDPDADGDGVPNELDCRPLDAGSGLCDDGNGCTDDACDAATGCVSVPAVGRSCEDGSACTTLDACDASGACVGGAPLACDDGNGCTDDACDAATGCVSVPAVGRSCEDGSACTTLDACDASGACVGGAPLACDDGNGCTDDACDAATGCVSVPAVGRSCEDGTTLDACDASGACVGGAPLVCDDGNGCTDDACAAATGCVSVPAVGRSCEDGSACTTLDACDASGACVGGAPLVCDDGIECTEDACDPTGGCTHVVRDDVPPAVAITAAQDRLLLDSSLPFASLFTAGDDDGFPGGVVRERAYWNDCLVFDGAAYGDGDGLLSDETLPVDYRTFCDAVERCGLRELDEASVRVEADDCAGNTGAAARTFDMVPALTPRACQAEITFDAGAAGRDRVRWTHVFLADAYDLVRGDVARLSAGAGGTGGSGTGGATDGGTDGGGVDLGPLACLANDAPMVEVPDPVRPDPGQAFFYLVRYRRANTLSEYGWSSADAVRGSGTEGCPP